MVSDSCIGLDVNGEEAGDCGDINGQEAPFKASASNCIHTPFPPPSSFFSASLLAEAMAVRLPDECGADASDDHRPVESQSTLETLYRMIDEALISDARCFDVSTITEAKLGLIPLELVCLADRFANGCSMIYPRVQHFDENHESVEEGIAPASATARAEAEAAFQATCQVLKYVAVNSCSKDVIEQPLQSHPCKTGVAGTASPTLSSKSLKLFPRASRSQSVLDHDLSIVSESYKVEFKPFKGTLRRHTSDLRNETTASKPDVSILTLETGIELEIVEESPTRATDDRSETSFARKMFCSGELFGYTLELATLSPPTPFNDARIDECRIRWNQCT